MEGKRVLREDVLFTGRTVARILRNAGVEAAALGSADHAHVLAKTETFTEA